MRYFFCFLSLLILCFPIAVADDQEPQPAENAGFAPEDSEEDSPFYDEEEENVKPQTSNAAQPLFLQEPFDLLTLSARYDGESFKIVPLEPIKRVRPIAYKEALVVRFQKDPFQEYHIRWENIDKIESFAVQVRKELQSRLDAFSGRVRQLESGTVASKTELAEVELLFDYFLFLKKYRSELNDFDDLYKKFIMEEAVFRIKTGDFPTGLERMEHLYRLDNNYPQLKKTWGSALDLQLQHEQQNNRPQVIRRALNSFAKFYPDHPIIGQWEKRLDDTIAQLQNQSNKALKKNDPVLAYDLYEQATKIVSNQTQLLSWKQELHQKAPRINIAVAQPIPKAELLTLDALPDWHCDRGRRLLCRMLCDYQQPGIEGGIYTSSIASIRKEDRAPSLQFLFPKTKDSSNLFETLFQLSHQASNKNRALLAQSAAPIPLMAGASLLNRVLSRAEIINQDLTAGENTVQFQFNRYLLVPEALFTFPLLEQKKTEESRLQPGTGLFKRSPTIENGYQHSSYKTGSNEPPVGPTVIFEHVIRRSEEVLQRFRNGEIDLVDRLAPWNVAEMKQIPEVQVKPYSVPTSYFIVPNHHKPLTGNRTFRRALLYGLNRSGMLAKLAAETADAQIGSVPFIKGNSMTDPLGYAYDTSIKPRPYEPKLATALLLSIMVELRNQYPELSANDSETELVLAYPDNETCQLIAMMIQRQWQLIGLKVNIIPYDQSTHIGRLSQIDFWLVDRSVREPLVDAFRLFSDCGLTGSMSPYMNSALEKLAVAKDWPSAAARLKEIHRLCHDETTVLPLWQITEYYAFKNTLTEVTPPTGIVSLYQNLHQWQLTKPPAK